MLRYDTIRARGGRDLNKEGEMPEDLNTIDAEEARIRALIARINQEAKEWAVFLDLPLPAGYDVLAVIHGQFGMGERDGSLLQGGEEAK